MKDELIFNNTYERGHTTFIIFKQVKSYIGVCLEFNLIVKCNSMKETYEHITDYAQAWLKNIVKNKLPEQLLNRPADEKYWKLAKRIDTERRFETFLNGTKKKVKARLPEIASIRRKNNALYNLELSVPPRERCTSSRSWSSSFARMLLQRFQTTTWASL